MKLSFSTLGCPDWTFRQILDQAQAMGYQGLEIRGIEGEMDNAVIPYFGLGRWEQTQKELKTRGLEIVNLGTSAMFHTPEKWQAAVDEAKAAIDTAEYMGVPFIRIFGDGIPEGADRQETLKQIAAGWSEVYAHSEGKAVTPLVEVHGHFNNVEIFKDVFQYFSHPKFAVLWDIEHSYKVYQRNFAEFFGFIRHYTRHVHVKDTAWVNGEWKLQNLGKGEIPIPLHVALLAATNYEGYLSLEWEKKWHPELDDCEVAFPEYVTLMRKILY